MTIHILTESAADLSPEQIRTHEIEVLPMTIHINGHSYKDNENITPADIFKAVSETGVYPITSAPSIEEYKTFFNRKGTKIFIGVSSALSSAFDHAKLAARELDDPDLHIFDSKSISTGIGQLVLKAAGYKKSGMDISAILHKLEMDIKQGRGLILLENLEFIRRGGRISAVEKWLGGLLQIRPLLFVQRDGNLGVRLRSRGNRKKLLNILAQALLNDLPEDSTDPVIITHLDQEYEANYLYQRLKSSKSSMNLLINNVGCLLASHSGPGAIGVAYSVLENGQK